MKVLIVRGFPEQLNIDSYNVQEIGLAAALRRRGVEADIVMFGGHEERQLTLDDGTIIYWLRGRNIVKNGIMPSLKKLAENYDVLQVHEYDQLQSWIVYTFWDRPCIVYHGLYASDWTKGYNTKCAVFDHYFLRFSGKGKRNTPCLTKSPLAAQFLTDRGFKIVNSVGVGLNPAPFLSDEEIQTMRQQHRTEGCLELAYIGKLEPRRSTDFMLRLMTQLAADPEIQNRIHFTAIGTGEKEYVSQVMPDIERLQAMGILTYREKATQSELAQLYPTMDILLFPSQYEIYGMVLLEAMYHGLVCISSYNGGSTTMIEDGVDGRVLQQFDENAWYQAIKDVILQDAEREQMSIKAMDKIRSRFLWDALAETFVQTYQRALEADRS